MLTKNTVRQMSISQQAWAYLWQIARRLKTLHNKFSEQIKRSRKREVRNSDTLAHRQKAKEILTLQHNVIILSTE